MCKEGVFEYKWLPGCQYSVPSKGTPEQEMDCGAPVVARVWWHWAEMEDEPSDAMLVCEEHLMYILACEAKEKIMDEWVKGQ